MPREWADEGDTSGRFFLRDSHFRYKVDSTGVHIQVFDDDRGNAWLVISPSLLEWMLAKVKEKANA